MNARLVSGLGLAGLLLARLGLGCSSGEEGGGAGSLVGGTTDEGSTDAGGTTEPEDEPC